ncbi:aromatic ring-hydroxylating dioxygenase subunit alpha [Hyphomicrobiales bacterium]|nr:aromatic ring-hydroxylating dioxygenase subunit alpha [Hyphomicrobiales bacterium]
MSKSKLLEIARNNKSHAEAGTMVLVDEIVKIPAKNYYDPDRWQKEVDLIFKRIPLVLSVSSELPNPGDYKAMDVVGVPVLLLRDSDGEIKAFLNACSHRGAALVENGNGNKKRFSCPYHAWTYNDKGSLIGISSPHEFGEIDKSCHNLIALPVLEKAGIIWATLDPKSKLCIEKFLSGYDSMLELFDLKNWHVHSQRTIKGPNWKVAYDGYLDLYHLPVLHSETFGTDISNQANYYEWGPHQRVISPYRSPDRNGKSEDFDELLVEDWPMDVLMAGVWTIFPHVSIASFNGGGRSILLSQLMPGDNPEDSYTNQYYLMEKKPNKKQAEEADKQFDLLEYVVREEDYATGLRLQKGLKTGMIDSVMFGRNEGGGQSFHAWVDKILKANDKDLISLFG